MKDDTVNQTQKVGIIKKAYVGYVANFTFAISFDLEGVGWKVTDYWADGDGWSLPGASDEIYSKMLLRLRDLISKSRVRNIDQLCGIPVVVTFIGNKMSSWRVLEELTAKQKEIKDEQVS